MFTSSNSNTLCLQGTTLKYPKHLCSPTQNSINWYPKVILFLTETFHSDSLAALHRFIRHARALPTTPCPRPLYSSLYAPRSSTQATHICSTPPLFYLAAPAASASSTGDSTKNLTRNAYVLPHPHARPFTTLEKLPETPAASSSSSRTRSFRPPHVLPSSLRLLRFHEV